MRSSRLLSWGVSRLGWGSAACSSRSTSSCTCHTQHHLLQGAIRGLARGSESATRSGLASRTTSLWGMPSRRSRVQGVGLKHPAPSMLLAP